MLEGIDLDIPEGSFEALMGPSGSGKTTLLNLIAGIDNATAGHGRGQRHRSDAARRGRSRVVALAQHRLHLPVLQPLAGVHGVPERRAAAAPHEPVEGRAQEARRDGAARGRPRGPHGPLSAPALGRAGAARRHRARHRHRSDDPRRRRADRRPRSQERRGDPEAARSSAPQVQQDHRHGHARSGAPRSPPRSSAGSTRGSCSADGSRRGRSG